MVKNLKNILEDDIRTTTNLPDRALAVETYKLYLEAIGNFKFKGIEAKILKKRLDD